MSDAETEGRTAALLLDFAIDAPPEKVWRAIEVPELREVWLPGCTLTDAEDLSTPLGREVRFRMRDGDAAHPDTTVLFRVRPRAAGGTTLTIVHEVPGVSRLCRAAANGNSPPLMQAA